MTVCQKSAECFRGTAGACLSAPSAIERRRPRPASTLKSRYAAIMRRKAMTTYIALFNLTDAGIKAAKDSPRRLDAAKKLLPTWAAR